MKTNQLKIPSRFLLCLGILLALLASVTIASAQGRNRNGNNGGAQGGFGNNTDYAGGGGGGFGNAGGGFGGNRGGGRNIGGVGSANVPAPTNYTAFTGFIAVRNIFNPNRYPSRGPANPPVVTGGGRGTRVPPVAQFSLVGTMAYEKGMFAFFDGNQSYLRKVLYQSASDNIAGYTVEEVTPSDVKLVSADKLQILRLKVGDGMRMNAGLWELAGQVQVQASDNFGGGGFAGGGFADYGASFSGGGASTTDSTPDSSAAPSPSLEGNSVLQRLMKLRQQQLGN